MNELIGSFAGKRLAIFGVLIAAIALLVAGGALSTRTAQAHDPTDTDRVTGGRADLGLDHIVAGEKHGSLKLTLAVGTRHHVCLVQNLHDQQFRADSDDTAEPGTPDDGDNSQQDPDGDGRETDDDIDDWDWDLAAPALGDDSTDYGEGGPRGIITTAPRAGSGIGGEATLTGWNWLIAKKANTPGTPTVTNPGRTFKNDGENGEEACVHWTSTAPGTQIIQLYSGTMLAATGVHVANFGAQDADFAYADDHGTHPATTAQGDDHNDNDWKLDDPDTQLEVTWVDSDPLITVTRAIGNFAPTSVTAPIAQRMDFVGGGAGDAAFTSENGGEITVNVAAVQSALMSQALTGASVSFAVTGTCGIVNVPGATVSTTPLVQNDIRPGQTGTIASWGTAPVVATFKNAGTGATDDYPKCRQSSSSTTLTITSGGASNTVTVNWDWDGYGVFTVDDVDDTTRRVNFHSATPKRYNALGQSVGWECNAAGQARILSYNVDGRATVTGGARLGESSPTVVTATSQGRATPQRTLGAGDSECQYSWTIKSPARAADVYVDITTLGVDAFSRVLNFAPEAPAVTTFDDLEAPLAPGIDFILWTGADTAVADAIGDSGATAVYQWNAATQSWLSFFPGSEGLGVNSLTSLQQGSIYVVSTPRN